MNKLPTKQIYLLIIIIVGIFALSVYSTYAIFTFEGETSDIVSIHTPNSLEISSDMYEYKQLTIPKNSYLTTDIDIYNTHDKQLCYSIWYKPVGKDVKNNTINILEVTEQGLSTTGVIEPMGSLRIPLIITNNNEEDTKVNIGVAFSISEGTCELNISQDKLSVKSTIKEIKELSELIIEKVGSHQNKEPYYLIYKNIEKEIILPEEKIYVSEKFTYQDEVFTLTEPKELESKDILKYISNETTSYYTCIDKTSCKYLYKINEAKSEEVDNPENNNPNEKEYIYKLTNYDMYEGYLKSTSGIKKVTTNNITNYVYYGDNPNNYIYYNCKDETDTNTCELWRIIGIYYDNDEQKYLTKIIKDESIGNYQYNEEEDNSWSKSSLFKYLNEEYEISNSSYLKNINIYEEELEEENITFDKISTEIVDIANNTDIDSETEIKFTIMSLSDYLNSSTCQNKLINEYDESCLIDNWLNRNLHEWTQTKKIITEEVISEPETTEETESQETTDDNETTEPETTIKVVNNKVFSVSTKLNTNLVTNELAVRPVGYLKSRVLVTSGDGSFENPYIIK